MKFTQNEQTTSTGFSDGPGCKSSCAEIWCKKAVKARSSIGLYCAQLCYCLPFFSLVRTIFTKPQYPCPCIPIRPHLPKARAFFPVSSALDSNYKPACSSGTFPLFDYWRVTCIPHSIPLYISRETGDMFHLTIIYLPFIHDVPIKTPSYPIIIHGA